MHGRTWNLKETLYRGLVTGGAVGAAAPTDFRKTNFALTNILENLTLEPSFLVYMLIFNFFLEQTKNSAPTVLNS